MRFFIIALINSFMVKQNWFAKNSRCIVILSAAKDLVYIHVGAFEMLHYVQHDKSFFAILII